MTLLFDVIKRESVKNMVAFSGFSFKCTEFNQFGSSFYWEESETSGADAVALFYD